MDLDGKIHKIDEELAKVLNAEQDWIAIDTRQIKVKRNGGGNSNNMDKYEDRILLVLSD